MGKSLINGGKKDLFLTNFYINCFNGLRLKCGGATGSAAQNRSFLELLSNAIILRMRAVLLVGIGGALGSILRLKFGGWVLHRWPGGVFPLSTLAVNLIGCFFIGLLAALAERKFPHSSDLRQLLFPGLLGGFTTFSAFGLEISLLLKQGHTAIALLYVGASVLGGVLSVFLGLTLVRA